MFGIFAAGQGGVGQAIARNLSWLLASKGVVAILSLAYLAIATRTLGVTNFGRFALIVAAAQALTAFVAFETWQVLVQYGSRHVQSRDNRALAALLRGCAAIDAVSAVLGVAAAAVILAFWHEELGIGATLQRATLIYAAAQLLSIRSTPIGMLRVRDRFSLAALVDGVTPVVRLVGAALVAIFHPTVEAFLAVWGLAEVLTAIAYWCVLAKTGDLRLLFSRDVGRVGLRRENPGIVRFLINGSLLSSLNLSTKQVPLLLTGAMVGTASAGAFRLASQFSQALTKLSQLISRAAFPEIVRAVSRDGVREAGAIFRTSLRYSGGVAIGIFLVIVLLGRPLLSLVGPGFGPAYPILLWLAAAGCVDLITVGFESLLLAAHRAGWALAARLLATVTMVVGALALAPVAGATGIAAAVLAYSLVVALLLGGVVLRLTART